VATQFLVKRGHEVVVAGNGRAALEALEKQAPDLVLMDVQMPEMDGLQATAAIRQGELKSGKAYSDYCDDSSRNGRGQRKVS
jgi:two-component system, sensor histidine kinase and response regulator